MLDYLIQHELDRRKRIESEQARARELQTSRQTGRENTVFSALLQNAISSRNNGNDLNREKELIDYRQQKAIEQYNQTTGATARRKNTQLDKPEPLWEFAAPHETEEAVMNDDGTPATDQFFKPIKRRVYYSGNVDVITGLMEYSEKQIQALEMMRSGQPTPERQRAAAEIESHLALIEDVKKGLNNRDDPHLLEKLYLLKTILPEKEAEAIKQYFKNPGLKRK